MKSEEKSREGPRLALVLLLLLLLPPRKLCLGGSGESGEGRNAGEAGLFGQLHLLVARRLSGLDDPSGASTKTG